MVQQRLDQVTDSFGLADCQELTFFLYFDQSKTSRRDSVKIYLVLQRGPATVRNLFWAMLSFLDNYVTHNFSHFRAALTGTTLLSAWSPMYSSVVLVLIVNLLLSIYAYAVLGEVYFFVFGWNSCLMCHMRKCESNSVEKWYLQVMHVFYSSLYMCLYKSRKVLQKSGNRI